MPSVYELAQFYCRGGFFFYFGNGTGHGLLFCALVIQPSAILILKLMTQLEPLGTRSHRIHNYQKHSAIYTDTICILFLDSFSETHTLGSGSMFLPLLYGSICVK